MLKTLIFTHVLRRMQMTVIGTITMAVGGVHYTLSVNYIKFQKFKRFKVHNRSAIGAKPMLGIRLTAW